MSAFHVAARAEASPPARRSEGTCSCYHFKIRSYKLGSKGAASHTRGNARSFGHAPPPKPPCHGQSPVAFRPIDQGSGVLPRAAKRRPQRHHPFVWNAPLKLRCNHASRGGLHTTGRAAPRRIPAKAKASALPGLTETTPDSPGKAPKTKIKYQEKGRPARDCQSADTLRPNFIALHPIDATHAERSHPAA